MLTHFETSTRNWNHKYLSSTLKQRDWYWIKSRSPPVYLLLKVKRRGEFLPFQSTACRERGSPKQLGKQIVFLFVYHFL